MKTNLTCLLLLCGCLGWGPVRAQLGFELNWRVMIDQFGRQSMPGSVLNKDEGLLIELSSGLLFGPQAFWQLTDDLRISAGAQIGMRRFRQRYGSGYIRYERVSRVRALMVPVQLAWTPYMGASKRWKWYLAAGGGLFWMDRLNFNGGYSNFRVQAWPSYGQPDVQFHSQGRLYREKPHLPAGMVSLAAGMEVDVAERFGIRMNLVYHWFVTRSLRFENEWVLNGEFGYVDNRSRGNFVGLEIATVLPFRMFKWAGDDPGALMED